MWNVRELSVCPPTLISEWEADDLLVKRRSGALTVCNASKALHGPTTPAQARAKGVVYNHETGEVVSQPFPKVWNWHEGEQFHRANSQGSFQALEKEDGTLIQTFVCQGRVHHTTRGSMPGVYEELSPELEIALRLWDERIQHPEHITLLWELVGPSNHILVGYAEDAYVLIGAHDKTRGGFLAYSGLEALFPTLFPADWDRNDYRLVRELPSSTLEGVSECNANAENHEGFVVSWVQDGLIHHSAKVKTDWWVRRMRSKCAVTTAEVVRRWADNPNIHTFDDLWAELMSEAGQEELLEAWRSVWIEASHKIDAATALQRQCEENLAQAALEGHTDAKSVALFLKAQGANVGLHMAMWRNRLDRGTLLRTLDK